MCAHGTVERRFFICCTPSRALDYNMGMCRCLGHMRASVLTVSVFHARVYMPFSHTVAFGKVVDGMELVDRISQLPTDDSGCPLQQVRIADCGKLSPVETDGSWLASLMSWFRGSRATSNAGT